jgi:cell division protein FtsI (penicillin-binding protein 3)
MSEPPFDFAAAPPADAAPSGRTLPQSPLAPLPRDRAMVRIAAPDLVRRAQLDTSRARLVIAASGFALLFGAVGLKLTMATLLDPVLPRPRISQPVLRAEGGAVRASITDRNGEVLAVSLPVTELYANPEEINDPVTAADRLRRILPQLDREALIDRLTQRNVPGSDRQVQFAYIARNLPPRQQQAVNDLGIPGFHFRQAERRFYPQGRVAAHVLGQVDIDGKGIAGVERSFDRRLKDTAQPLRLSIDVRVQVALRDSVNQAMLDFNGIGAAGVVLDANTAEVLAMVSLPDYDASDPGSITRKRAEGGAGQGLLHFVANRAAAPRKARPEFDAHANRATMGLYEPGSTFKLLTAAMALDAGTANLWSIFDAAHPIKYGRFTIEDYRGKRRALTLPEVLAYSSNLGAARMAMGVGIQRHREFMAKMGLLDRLKIELPEVQRPMAPSAQNWRDINTMTIAFGHGISVSPLHVATAMAAVANGGILRQPTIVAHPDGAPREGTRVVSERTSETMRKLMRLVVTNGSGRQAEVEGYFVGGKTGTAEKNGRFGYLKDKRVAAFIGAFPMNAPRYVVYVMIDEPKPNAKSHGTATAGWVAAPAAGAVIRRIAPVLGMIPENERAAQIQQSISIPMHPARGRAQVTTSPAVPRAAAATVPPRPAMPALAPARPPVAPPSLPAIGQPPALRRTELPAVLQLAATTFSSSEVGLASQ